MLENDPEKYAADLERRLAVPRDSAPLQHIDQMLEVTSDDVRDVAFSKPARGRRGYHEGEVDALLDLVETTLANPTRRDALTAAQIHGVSFSPPPIGRRGYNEDEVDDFLRRIARQLSSGSRQPSALDRRPSCAADYGAKIVAQERHSKHDDRSVARTFVDAIYTFWAVLVQNDPRHDWRSPLVLGLLFILLGFTTHPAHFVIAGFALLWAAVVWRDDKD
jgi:DivIVA domain-containing protein